MTASRVALIRIERSDCVFEVLMASRMNIRHPKDDGWHDRNDAVPAQSDCWHDVSNRTDPEPHHSEFSVTTQIEPVHGEFVFRIGSVLDQAELSFYNSERAVAIWCVCHKSQWSRAIWPVFFLIGKNRSEFVNRRNVPFVTRQSHQKRQIHVQLWLSQGWDRACPTL